MKLTKNNKIALIITAVVLVGGTIGTVIYLKKKKAESEAEGDTRSIGEIDPELSDISETTMSQEQANKIAKKIRLALRGGFLTAGVSANYALVLKRKLKKAGYSYSKGKAYKI